MFFGRTTVRCLLAGTLAISALAVTACGSSSKKSSGGTSPSGTTRTVSLSITEAGRGARFTLPASAPGGLVTISLKNEGKQPHSAQFILLRGRHTVAQALKLITGNSPKTPSWIRGEGGVGVIGPGQTGTATVNLPAGRYGVFELPGPTAGNGPPASGALQITGGTAGTLPSTGTTVTAATAGKDRYKWNISGPINTGSNRVTFESKGNNSIHLISAVRLTRNASKAQIIKGLQSNGPPPAFIDPSTFAETAVLDGGKSSVTDLSLAKPGRYVLFCPLADRDGGKPHFAEGLLKTITIK